MLETLANGAESGKGTPEIAHSIKTLFFYCNMSDRHAALTDYM